MVQEKREYSRINTRLKALAKKVSGPEVIPAFHASNLSPNSMDNRFLQDTNLPEDVKKFLQTIDQKLDTLLGLQSQKILEKEYDIQTEITELSGAGLKCLQTDSYLQVNDYIEIVLFLSYHPVNMASGIGMVQRLENDVAVIEFTSMRESERESIVQFVFQEQREQIRSTRYE